MDVTVNREFRPIVIFGHYHEDDLIWLKATLVKSGIGNFVAGRLDEGGACEDVARAALVIISTAATSSKERRRIGRAAKRHAVPLLFLSDWKKS